MCKSLLRATLIRSCYTNHALDQFLEHLLDVRPNIQVVRIGSRSKSELLKDYNLRELIAGEKTRKERATERGIHVALENEQTRGNKLCENLTRNPKKWLDFSDFLERKFPNQFAILSSSVGSDGFQMAGVKSSNCFDRWAFGKDMRNKNWKKMHAGRSRKKELRSLESLLLPTTDIWGMSKKERKLVLDHWKKHIRQEWFDNLTRHIQKQQEKVRELNSHSSQYKRRVLEAADVIGLTTTGLAKHAPLLRQIGSKTLICEEAGEVLEVI